MKILSSLVILSLFVSCSKLENESGLLKLSLEPVMGYADFERKSNDISWKPINPKNPWLKTKPVLTGIPSTWKQTKTDDIIYDLKQFAYQNYRIGKLSKEMFSDLMTAWNIDTINNPLSSQPILCSSNIVIGYLNDSIVYKLDTDNDCDFEDEKTMYPVKDSLINSINVANYIHNISFEYFHDNQIIYSEIPLLITEKKGMIWYSIPQYYQTSLGGNKILVSTGFRKATFIEDTFVKLADSDKESVTRKGEFVVINGVTYKNMEANFTKKELALIQMPKDTVLYSTQVGYSAIPFSGKDLITDSIINLNDYKGKFVYVEFWGSWCKGCVNEIENLKNAYSKMDKDKVEFIGIAYDNKKRLKKFIKENDITWPQVLSTRKNDIMKLYKLVGVPNFFLIDKEGVIVSNSIRGENIAEEISKYIE
ncbi:TlpA family protein disulfide reductase [Marinilabiliaceae bacterium JC017]|nr:TlpA family protein disulfide reductase [Marinilabiliaceae bacterium JC017]